MQFRRLGWIAAGIVGIVLLAALGWSLLTTMKKAPSLEGSPAPPLAIRSLQDGSTVRLTSLQGKPVVLNFWASWCVPCRQEAQTLNAAAHRYGGRVHFVGADIQDSDAAARRFQDEVQAPYPTGPIVKGSYHDFGVTAPPETFFIDRQGVVSAKIIGPVDNTRLKVAIEELEP